MPRLHVIPQIATCQATCQALLSMEFSVHGILCPWNSPGKNTGVRCHSLLQGIFSTQGSNLQCRQIPYHLSHQGSPIFSEGDLSCLNWNILNLQCCVICWCTAKWYIYIHTLNYIYTFYISFIIVYYKIISFLILLFLVKIPTKVFFFFFKDYKSI